MYKVRKSTQGIITPVIKGMNSPFLEDANKNEIAMGQLKKVVVVNDFPKVARVSQMQTS